MRRIVNQTPWWVSGLVVIVLLCAPATAAQDMRDLVDAALDQQVDERIVIEKQPMRDALAALEEQTGLRFALHELAIEWMPAGAETRLSIVIEGTSVRKALRRVFAGLGLSMRVADDCVLVEPGPVLDRLGRRLDVREVQLLQRLAGATWTELKDEHPGIVFELPEPKQARRALDETIVEIPGHAIEQLEVATQQLGWHWVPQGRAIVVYSRVADVQQRLDRELNVYYQRLPLDKLLVDLGRRTGVLMRFEPGALERVEATDRQVDLIQRGTTARQVLELICGNTGLWYEVTPECVVIGAASTEAPPPPRPRVVAILRVPMEGGTTFDILLREDQLPAEYQALMNRLIEQKLPEVVDVLREQVEGGR